MDARTLNSTSNIVRFKLTSSVTGAGLTGLDHTSSGLIISTICDNEATAVSYAVGSSNVETITTLGTFSTPSTNKCRFKAVDSTNHPGLYEFQFANARFAVASSKRMVITVSGATNLLQTDYQIAIDPAADVQMVQGSQANATKLYDICTESSSGIVLTDVALWGGNALPANFHNVIEGLYEGTLELITFGFSGDAAADIAALGTSLGVIAGYIDTEVAAIKAKTDLITADMATFATRGLTMLVLDGMVYQFTANAVELAPSGGTVSAFSGAAATQVTSIETNTTTLLSRLGAFTGSGLNTILGFFRALMRKDASLTPSDVGGTFDNTTDSNEAIKDAGVGGGGGSSINTSVEIEEIRAE